MAKSPKKRRAAKKHTGTKVTAPSLTMRQKRLCDIYHAMKTSNKQKAYELAGYKCRGKTAKTEAQREMDKPHVKAYLDSLKEVATERAQKTKDEIIAELEKVGFSRTQNRNKVRALELLGRRFNLFPNRQEITGKDGGPLKLNVTVTKTYKNK